MLKDTLNMEATTGWRIPPLLYGAHLIKVATTSAYVAESVANDINWQEQEKYKIQGRNELWQWNYVNGIMT